MKLEDIEVFVEAVKAGSLAGAARRLSMSAMAASRALTHLEAELGVRLVHRTTRSLSPTSDGEIFLPHAQALLEDKSNALADLFPDGTHLSGIWPKDRGSHADPVHAATSRPAGRFTRDRRTG